MVQPFGGCEELEIETIKIECVKGIITPPLHSAVGFFSI